MRQFSYCLSAIRRLILKRYDTFSINFECSIISYFEFLFDFVSLPCFCFMNESTDILDTNRDIGTLSDMISLNPKERPRARSRND